MSLPLRSKFLLNVTLTLSDVGTEDLCHYWQCCFICSLCTPQLAHPASLGLFLLSNQQLHCCHQLFVFQIPADSYHPCTIWHHRYKCITKIWIAYLDLHLSLLHCFVSVTLLSNVTLHHCS